MRDAEPNVKTFLVTKDVNLRVIGGSIERMVALQKGIVQFTVVTEPGKVQAEKLGYPMVVDMVALQIPFPQNGIYTSTKLIRDNPDLVRRYMRAYVEATHYFKTRKEDSKKIVGKYFPTASAAYLEDNYTTTTRILEQVPYVTRPGMENLIQEARASNPAIKVTVNDVVDDTIVRELEKQGFIDALYGKK